MGTRRRFSLSSAAILPVLGVIVLALPAAGALQREAKVGNGVLAHLSQSVAVHYWAARPEQAPPQLQAPLKRLAHSKHGVPAGQLKKVPNLINGDVFGLPQDEESVTVCRSNRNVVLGGTNDFRGLLDPEGNFTGWHLSTDGGAGLTNEALLPSIDSLPSGGDPVEAADDDCNLYAGSLNFTPTASFLTEPNGVGVYKSNAATLATCPGGGSDPSCWPVRRIVAASPNVPGGTFPSHFFDKEWIDVGKSGSAGTVVWIVFSDFLQTGPGIDTLDFTASIKAVRCSADLATCTPPILISGADQDIQFGDVTIGPDGRTYLTWSEIVGELPGSGGLPGQPQTFIHKLRIAPAGSTVFGPTRTIATEDKPLPFNGFLHANDFRIATYLKNAVALVGGKPRIFVTWDACQARALDSICEEPEIKLTFSDDGASWSDPSILSSGGDNYFPTISADPKSGLLAVAWYTSRFDPAFHNQQDVELVTVDAATTRARGGQRLTAVSNETEADPLLGGLFIGDYFEVFAQDRRAWVHFNANYRQIPFLGDGPAVNQQDNFLIRTHL